jgi:hypothetical protein
VTPPAFKVRIVRPPIGEAPEWVRRAWVGLELPLAVPQAVTLETSGVLTGPRSWPGYWWARLTGRLQVVSGYVVASDRAIDLLGRSRPEAAAWWRTHAPDFCQPGAEFIFDAPACEPSPEPAANAPWG